MLCGCGVVFDLYCVVVSAVHTGVLVCVSVCVYVCGVWCVTAVCVYSVV